MTEAELSEAILDLYTTRAADAPALVVTSADLVELKIALARERWSAAWRWARLRAARPWWFTGEVARSELTPLEERAAELLEERSAHEP